MRYLPVVCVLLSRGFYAACIDLPCHSERRIFGVCPDLPCHSERSIEDAESKNPLLFDGAVSELGYTPPPSVRTGHLPSKGGFGAAGELVR